MAYKGKIAKGTSGLYKKKGYGKKAVFMKKDDDIAADVTIDPVTVTAKKTQKRIFSDKPIYSSRDEALIDSTAKTMTNIVPERRRKFAIDELKKANKIKDPKRRYEI